MTLRAALTERRVKTLPAASEGRRYDAWDAIVPGLSVRVTDSGAKSWTVVGRVHGRPLRATLGSYPDLGIAAAREKAREALEAIANGRHPRRMNRRGDVLLVTDALTTYLASRNWTKLYRANVNSAVARYIKPTLGPLAVGEVTRSDVADMLATLEKHPARAGSVLSYTSGFFRWALERDLVDKNPCAVIRQPSLESRDRVYSDPELRAIWRNAQTLGRPYDHFVRFLLVTAQRRGQAMAMKWAEIDDARGLWTSYTKEKRLHPVPLSDLAAEILKDCLRIGDHVFTSTGKKGMTNLSYLARKMREADGTPADFRLHDLRRTAATRMAELGVKPWIVDAVLDHVAGGVSGIYNRYGYVDEMRHGLQLWSDRLREILAAG